MSDPPAKLPPQKLRLNCTSCSTLCEVQIPAMDPNRKKPVRFQIKCPKCHTLNEMRANPPAPPPDADGPAAAASAGQKRGPTEGATGPPTKKPATGNGSSSSSRMPKPAPAPAPAKPKPAAAPPKPKPEAKPKAPPKPKPAKPPAAKPPASAPSSSSSGGRGKSGGGSSKSGGGRGGRGSGSYGGGGAGASSSTTVDELDDFIIEEASERLPSNSEGSHHGGGGGGSSKAKQGSGGGGGSSHKAKQGSGLKPTGKLIIVGAKPRITQTSAFERAFPTIHNSATHSCELAYEQAQDRPRWKEDDEVEVAFKGKGFEGSWSLAKVVKPDGRSDILVRYVDFVDNDGTPLVEHVPMDRLRLPPPPAPSGWVPGLGEPVEGFWNDCWWEGCVREFHVYKGILFQCVACRHMHARAAHTHMDGLHACAANGTF